MVSPLSLPIRRREVPVAAAERWQSTGIDSRLALLYAARGIAHPEDVAHRLAYLPPWQLLLGASEAAVHLAQAVLQRERVLIVGDFDADGATSTALAVRFLRELGADAHFLVPDRFVLGYGLTPELVEKAIAEYQPVWLITVDNGITSVAGAHAAKQAGLRLIITDHHLPGDELPVADAIVNPHLCPHSFPSQSLAGVGVVFYLLCALRAVLSEQHFFATVPKPSMVTWLDLVALGTVCDVVPLDRVNRILVSAGLERMRKGLCCPGIVALLQAAKKDLACVTASDLGFSVGPRLNAAGRLQDMSVGIACLLADTAEQAAAYAVQLQQLNDERQQLQSGMFEQARDALGDVSEKEPILCVYRPDFHSGIVGLLAGKLKEQFHRPAFVFAPQDPNEPDGLLKGSARSISGWHLRDALAEVHRRAPHIMDKFGGHAMAAGLTLPAVAWDEFRRVLAEVAQSTLPPEALSPVYWTDGALGAENCSLQWARMLERAGPWGAGFPEPVFDEAFLVLGYRYMGEGNRHLRLNLLQPDTQTLLQGVYFHCQERGWDPSWTHVHVAFKLQVNRFRGKESLQLLVEALFPV